jgi:hypothetical protein
MILDDLYKEKLRFITLSKALVEAQHDDQAVEPVSG